jgi:hypothetical protein
MRTVTNKLFSLTTIAFQQPLETSLLTEPSSVSRSVIHPLNQC